MRGYYIGRDTWQRVSWYRAVPQAEWTFIPAPQDKAEESTEILRLALHTFNRPSQGCKSEGASVEYLQFCIFELAGGELTDDRLTELLEVIAAFRSMTMLQLSAAPRDTANPQRREGPRSFVLAAVPFRFRGLAADLAWCGFDAVVASEQSRRAVAQRLAAFSVLSTPNAAASGVAPRSRRAPRC